MEIACSSLKSLRETRNTRNLASSIPRTPRSSPKLGSTFLRNQLARVKFLLEHEVHRYFLNGWRSSEMRFASGKQLKTSAQQVKGNGSRTSLRTLRSRLPCPKKLVRVLHSLLVEKTINRRRFWSLLVGWSFSNIPFKYVSFNRSLFLISILNVTPPVVCRSINRDRGVGADRAYTQFRIVFGPRFFSSKEAVPVAGNIAISSFVFSALSVAFNLRDCTSPRV